MRLFARDRGQAAGLLGPGFFASISGKSQRGCGLPPALQKYCKCRGGLNPYAKINGKFPDLLSKAGRLLLRVSFRRFSLHAFLPQEVASLLAPRSMASATGIMFLAGAHAGRGRFPPRYLRQRKCWMMMCETSTLSQKNSNTANLAGDYLLLAHANGIAHYQHSNCGAY